MLWFSSVVIRSNYYRLPFRNLLSNTSSGFDGLFGQFFSSVNAQIWVRLHTHTVLIVVPALNNETRNLFLTQFACLGIFPCRSVLINIFTVTSTCWPWETHGSDWRVLAFIELFHKIRATSTQVHEPILVYIAIELFPSLIFLKFISLLKRGKLCHVLESILSNLKLLLLFC